MKRLIRHVAPVLVMISCVLTLHAQSGQTLFGDIHVDENNVAGLKAPTLIIILYAEGGNILQRQTATINGRYRFNNLPQGVYVLGVEVEGKEITRMRVDMRSPLLGDLRQDIDLAWKSDEPAGTTKPAAISAADFYRRVPENQSLFDKAKDQNDKKHYNQAAETLSILVKNDPKDFQAWTELGNVHYLMKSYADSENDYFRAIDLHPKFFLAVLNLGRLEVAQQKYDMAIDVLTKALEIRADSADANYLLGEAYLQVKKGSLAVNYLNEALKLDPLGMAEVHLRLATLYHHAGLPAKAAAEYEQFLKKKPDYPDKKKLQDYITANKKP